jgi:hypothetical protein
VIHPLQNATFKKETAQPDENEGTIGRQKELRQPIGGQDLTLNSTCSAKVVFR